MKIGNSIQDRNKNISERVLKINTTCFTYLFGVLVSSIPVYIIPQIDLYMKDTNMNNFPFSSRQTPVTFRLVYFKNFWS